MILVTKYQSKKDLQQAAGKAEGAEAAENEDQHDSHSHRSESTLISVIRNPFD
jgi:hypothetical protein